MTMLGKPPVANFLRSFCWVFMDLGVYLNLELITNSCFLRSFVDNLTKECVCVCVLVQELGRDVLKMQKNIRTVHKLRSF